MKFSIRFNGRVICVEAESVVQAITKIIDICSGMADNTEFQITELINSSGYQFVCSK